jgi:hypothetical protein
MLEKPGMKRIRQLAQALAASALLLAATQASAVEVSSGSAAGSLILDELQATVVFGSVSPAPDGAIVNGATSVTAEADGVVDGDFALDLLSALTASAASTSASASSSASNGLMAASVTAGFPGRARAESMKSGQIDFIGSGMLVVQVPYSLQVDLSVLADDTSFVRAEVGLNAFKLGSTAQYSSMAVLLFDIGSGPGSNASNGFLSLAIPFADGDQFTVIAGVTAEIATTLVPVPPALLLFGSGLVAVFARRRVR